MVTTMAFVAPTDRYFMIAKNLDIFASLFKQVDELYVDQTQPDKLMEHAIDGMLSSLDPYTNFIPEKESEAFRTSTTGEYAGIGAQISIVNDEVYISMLYEGFAAHRAGLKIGDKLVEIERKTILHPTIKKVSQLLKGQPKSMVAVKILRSGNVDTLSFEIKREKIKVKNITYYGLIENDIGYIRLEEFTSGAGQEVREATMNLKSLGAKGLILDLRDNPGGLLSEAVNVCNVFISKNRLIVETKGKAKEWNRKYKTLNNSIDEKIPLAVLINYGSASASEIVAGVIQDYDRGILVGSKTFGKGLVQTTRPLTYSSQLKVTTAKYYIPSGRCIQAINYSKDKVPLNRDSIGRQYETRNGRVVYDGTGLKPDRLVSQSEYAAITDALVSQGYIFRYVNHYIGKDSLPAGQDISDTKYQNFVRWVSNQDFDYETQVGKGIENLVQVSKEESYFNSLNYDITQLKLKVTENKEKGFSLHKEQIKLELEKEIALRLNLMKGLVKKSIQSDEIVLEAISSLKNKNKYKEVLTRK